MFKTIHRWAEPDNHPGCMNKLLSRRLLAAAALTMLAVVAHARGLVGGWHLDDELFIAVHQPAPGPFDPASLLRPRGIATASLHLNHWVGGNRPMAFHLVNLAIHAASALAAWCVLREAFVHRCDRWPGPLRSLGPSIAWSAAAVWAVHPITTQAVTYIVQRMELMWSLAFLVGLWAYLAADRLDRSDPPARWSVGSAGRLRLLAVAAWWMGMGCKEPIVTALMALPACDWVFGRLPGGDRWSISKWLCSRGTFWAVVLAPVLVAAPVVLPMLLDPSKTASGGFRLQSIRPWEYWVSQPAALGLYVTRTLWPVGLCFDHLWPPARLSATTAVQVAAAALVVAAIAWGIGRRKPAALAGLLFVTAVATSSLVPLTDIVVEHRAYLASLWIVVAGLCGMAMVVSLVVSKDEGPNASLSSRRVRPIFLGMVTICITVLAGLTWQRSSVYDSEWSLWSDTVAKAPWNYRAQVNLAEEHRRRGRTKLAVRHARRAVDSLALERQPDFQKANVHAALAAALSDDGQADAAVETIQKAVDLTPGGSEHLLNLASIQTQHGRFDAAVTTLQRAIVNRPSRGLLRQKLGVVLALLGRWSDAAGAFAEADRRGDFRDQDPSFRLPAAYLFGDRGEAALRLQSLPPDVQRQVQSRLADALQQTGRRGEVPAEGPGRPAGPGGAAPGDGDDYRRAIADKQYDLATRLLAEQLDRVGDGVERIQWLAERGRLLGLQGNLETAAANLASLTRDHPTAPTPWAALGDVQRWTGQLDSAQKSYRRSIDNGSRSASVFNNLAILLSTQEPRSAEEFARRAVRLEPLDYHAWHTLGNCLLRRDQIDEAITAYRRALRINPNFAPSRSTLAKLSRRSVD